MNSNSNSNSNSNKNGLTAAEYRKRFTASPSTLFTFAKLLPPTVADVWEKIADSRDGKKVTRRVACIDGRGLRDFIRALPQGPDRERAAAFDQILRNVAGVMSPLETGIYRVEESAGGKFPWRVSGAPFLQFTPGMASPAPKPVARVVEFNEAATAILSQLEEEKAKTAAEAEAARVAAREAAAVEVREAAAALAHCEGVWKALDASHRDCQERAGEAFQRADGKKKGAEVDAWKTASAREAECKAKADEAWDALRKSETTLARKRAIAAAI